MAQLEQPVPEISTRQVIAHTDSKPEHLLVSSGGDRIVGVIDWADACLAAPEVDVAMPLVWLGEGFVDDVVDVYEGNVDPRGVDASIFRIRCWSLRFLRTHLDGGHPGPIELLRAQVNAAFTSGSSPATVR